MFAGKVAVITGSTSGIGYGIARVLAGKGCNIMLNGFGQPSEIDKVRNAISDLKVKVAYSGADMSKPNEIREMIHQAEKDLGKVDILINNAGIQYTAPLEEFPDEKWAQIISINLSSNFHSVKAVLPGMQSRGWGRIINIASVHGLVGSVNKSAYVAAKHGVVGLTKVIALENATKGITCNAVCPGWVLTPLVQKQIDDLAALKKISEPEARSELLGAKQPLKDFATPEQIGELVAFLASDNAKSITGASYTIDGAWTSQ